jgi:hypothetical protein
MPPWLLVAALAVGTLLLLFAALTYPDGGGLVPDTWPAWLAAAGVVLFAAVGVALVLRK